MGIEAGIVIFDTSFSAFVCPVYFLSDFYSFNLTGCVVVYIQGVGLSFVNSVFHNRDLLFVKFGV